MRIVFFMSLLICTNLVAATSEDHILVPDNCIEKKQLPCLIRAKADSKIKWNDQTVYLKNEALLKIDESHSEFNFNLLIGQMRIQSDQKYKIVGYEIQNDNMQFVSTEKNNLYIFDLGSLDFKTFTNEKANPNDSASFVFQKSEFLNRKSLVQYFSIFYTSKAELKKELNDLSKKYQIRLIADSKKQAEFLQSRMNREIASMQNVEKQRIAAENENQNNRKRSRELFFMRTFQR